MKRFITIFCISAFVYFQGTAQNKRSDDDLVLEIEQIIQHSFTKTILNDRTNYNFPFKLTYKLNNQIEKQLLSYIYIYLGNVLNGNFTSSYSSYSKAIHEVEVSYQKYNSSFEDTNGLKWLCPFILSSYYFDISNYELALDYINEAERFILSMDKGKETSYYIQSMILKSLIITEMDQSEDALDLMKKVLEILKSLGFEDTVLYFSSEYTIAEIYSSCNQMKLACEYYEKALKKYKKIFNEESIFSFRIHTSLVNCAASLDETEYIAKAFEYLLDALLIIDRLEISDTELLLNYYVAYLMVCIQIEDLETINEITLICWDLITDVIKNKLPLMTETERKNFLEIDCDPFFNWLLPIITYENENDYFSYLMYYALLQSRGIQLNCNNYFINFIEDSKKPTMKELLSDLNKLKTDYFKNHSKIPINKKLLKNQKSKIEYFEYSLLEMIRKEGFNILSWMDVTPEDIQIKLNEEEIAVEFFSVPQKNESSLYCALVLNNDTTSFPKYIELLNEDEVKRLKSSPYELGDSIWGPIVNNFPNCRKIYFAPCGELINFPIELCVNETASEQNSLIRLTSTREIALNNKKTFPSNDIMLIGDLNYNQSLQTTIDETNKLINNNLMVEDLIYTIDTNDEIEGIYELLPGTKKELESIETYINDEFNTIKIVGKHGIELSFKMLSGKPYKIIHIATHGYFNNHGNSIKTAMNNCGLIFSGVNGLETCELLPYNLDDGKLTATEISNLNLIGTELVCLSACNSGIASISSEGAFGLQRGFKLAGVNSIIMSLWEIPDEGPTNLMMNSFYKYYFDLNDIYKSYLMAVKDVKEAYPNFKDWASFILLDAI